MARKVHKNQKVISKEAKQRGDMVKSYMPRRKERERHCFRKKDHVKERE